MRAGVCGAGLVAVVAACAPSVPAPPTGIPGASAPEVELAADAALTTAGQSVWTLDLPSPVSSTRQVSTLGRLWFLVGTDPDRQDRMTQFVGRVEDGGLVSQVTYDRAVGFPVTGRRMSVGVQSTSTARDFVVRAWDTSTGRRVWRTPVVAEAPQASVRVAGLAGDVVLVRPSIADQGVFQLSSLLALRQDNGDLAWRLQTDRGLRTVTPGPLVTVAYRTDEQRDGPVTRVSFIRPADGRTLAEVPWQDYRNHFRPAATAVTKNRVLLRGDRDNAGDIHVAVARADGRRVWHVSARAEPAVDFDKRVIAIARRDGSVEARRLLDGVVIWRWTPEFVRQTQVELGRGAYGVFWGNAGPDNIVVDSGTGEVLFTGSLSAVDPARWNGRLLITDTQPTVSAVSGKGVPIGFEQSAPPARALFVAVPTP